MPLLADGLRLARANDLWNFGRCLAARKDSRANRGGSGEGQILRHKRAARRPFTPERLACAIGRVCREPEARTWRLTAAAKAAKPLELTDVACVSRVGHCSHWRNAVIRTALTTTSAANTSAVYWSAGRKQRTYRQAEHRELERHAHISPKPPLRLRCCKDPPQEDCNRGRDDRKQNRHHAAGDGCSPVGECRDSGQLESKLQGQVHSFNKRHVIIIARVAKLSHPGALLFAHRVGDGNRPFACTGVCSCSSASAPVRRASACFLSPARLARRQLARTPRTDWIRSLLAEMRGTGKQEGSARRRGESWFRCRAILRLPPYQRAIPGETTREEPPCPSPSC